MALVLAAQQRLLVVEVLACGTCRDAARAATAFLPSADQIHQLPAVARPHNCNCKLKAARLRIATQLLALLPSGVPLPLPLSVPSMQWVTQTPCQSGPNHTCMQHHSCHQCCADECRHPQAKHPRKRLAKEGCASSLCVMHHSMNREYWQC